MSLLDIAIKNTYRSHECLIGRDFLSPVLSEAIIYKRAVGFFSSTSLIDTAWSYAKIAKKRGQIRLICSPELSEQDIEAIKKGYQNRDDVIAKSMMDKFIDHGNLFELERLNYLAHLISSEILDIKVAIVNAHSSIGMYHEKFGVIQDEEGHKVCFVGSLNESKNAFYNNFESISVFRDWIENDRVSEFDQFFDNLWNNTTNSIDVIDFPSAVKSKLLTYMRPTYKEPTVPWDDEERSIMLEPRVNIDLYKYQKDAINRWFELGCRGVFDMATGTGKTYTGLAASVRLLERKEKKLTTIVLCPYQHLVDQWVEDAEQFNIYPHIGYSSSPQRNWLSDFQRSIIDCNDGIINYVYIFITISSFRSQKFQKVLELINHDILLIADEAHNLGAKNIRVKLTDKFTYRIALSATIDRFRDEEGSEYLHEYFGEKCIEYSLGQAIKEKKLCDYDYYPIITTLSENELSHYIALSENISKCVISKNNGGIKLTKHGEFLAIERARLVAGANHKIVVLKKLLENYLNEHNILVYCGTSIYSENDKEIRQIEKICQILGSDLDMKIARFSSIESSKQRREIKGRFENGDDLQALVAIKCLDEGVNIPSIQTAFILASTTNPREYIQRRGRVLRRFNGKDKATIFDFVTLPYDIDSKLDVFERENIRYVQSLVRNEINRMKEFSNLCLNPTETVAIIGKLIDVYRLNQFEINEVEDFILEDNYE